MHVAYRRNIKAWSVRKEHKVQSEKEKTRVQTYFKERMGLAVDVPRAGGSGTSNDGNTARRAFGDPVAFSDITGVNLDLIIRFSIILRVLSSQRRVNAGKFEVYGLVTANLFRYLYPWFFVPVSVHKPLIHEADVIRSLLL